jgi:uncharacterized protein YkwD
MSLKSKPVSYATIVGFILLAACQSHSEEMARHGFYSHVDLKGQNAFARLNEAKVSYAAAAENLAYGQQTARQVLTAWLNSPGHRKNIDNCKYTRHGVGLAGARWTHVFLGDALR